MRAMYRRNPFVWNVLALAFVLRLAVILLFFMGDDLLISDAYYYVELANEPMRIIYTPLSSAIAIGPTYPTFLTPYYSLIPDSLPLIQVFTVRIIQVLMDTVTVGLVYLLVQRIFGDQRMARLALIGMALDARHIFVLAALGTETLFIMLMVSFLLAYLDASKRLSIGAYIFSGILLGFAVLTRPIALMFPAALLLHAWFASTDRRKALQGIAVTGIVMAVIMLPWTLRTWVITGSIVPVSTSAATHFWMSSRDDAEELGGRILEIEAVEDTAASEEEISISEVRQDDYVTAALKNILGQPGAWISRITVEVVKSYVRPYGPNLFASESDIPFSQVLREAASGERTILDVFGVPGFIPRVWMYIWHYLGLGLGIVGMVIAWLRFRWTVFPLIAWIAYNTALLAALRVEPRYLFPVMFAYTIFAAYAVTTGWEWVQSYRLRRMSQVEGQV